MSDEQNQEVPIEQSDRFKAVLEREVQESLVLWLRRGLGVGIVLYASFGLLDWSVAPSALVYLLSVRAAVILAAAIAIWATHTKPAQKYLKSVSMVTLYIAASGISVMTPVLGGFSSNYYFGLLLVLFFVGLFMPWNLRMAIGFCAAVASTYFLSNLIFSELTQEALPAAFYLMSTCVFTCLAVHAGDSARRKNLSLRLQLEKANEDLQELDKAKTAFFANVSHELRTPLTLMLGPVESLLQEANDDDRRALLRAMLANTHRLLRHVNLLLDAAKLEAGQLKLEPTVGNLSDLIHELVTASLPHAGRKGIAIATEGLEELPEVSFDADKIEMVAANLLSNALKFTPDGGRIVVRGRTEVGVIVFEVEDNGPGIPENERALIFDRFHQVDSSLTRQEEGTGLGLTLARELARLHGGDVTVDSEVGRGSVFRVSLPRQSDLAGERRQSPRRREDQLVRARADAMARREYQRRSRQDTLLADIRQPRLTDEELVRREAPKNAPRILVVDDNADLRAYLTSELSSKYRIYTAVDGVEGLKAALKLRPQLVIADVMMPRMNGYELCRRLRAEPMLQAVPIILVTAKAGSEAAVEGLEVGADDYVTKPFSMEELEARIAAQLRAKTVESQLSERETRLAAIGHLTSTVVHDLRNALTLIKGYSDLAHSIAVGGGHQDELVADIEQVQSATQRLQRMTTEILEFARGGAADVNLVAVPLSGYLRATLGPLTKHLAGQGVELRFRDELPTDLEVPLDADRFRRVLENLIGNARDALVNHSGDRIVLVSSRVKEAWLEIRVADTGPGILPELVNSLFEPFATGKTKGTGLGLVTVRNLVKAHGGRVDVEPESEEGGAAFTVSIPINGEQDVPAGR